MSYLRHIKLGRTIRYQERQNNWGNLRGLIFTKKNKKFKGSDVLLTLRIEKADTIESY